MNFAQTFNLARGRPQINLDAPISDTSEQIYISSLALIKMLKHGRAGVPLEVMGLMLGEFVDEYTVKVVDVFAMPQSGTGVSVEAVDPEFQAKMTEMLKQTGRTEIVVGWYHSHPGFGPWLSSVDVNTQRSFEQLNERAVAVVVDPIQSVKGRVVIDAFRLIPQEMVLFGGMEPRQTTSNIGHIVKPSIQTLTHGLNKHYYSIAINYRKSEYERQMLLNLYKKKWIYSLMIKNYETQSKENQETAKDMSNLAKLYTKWIQEETKKTREEFVISTVGKIDPKRHLTQDVEKLFGENINQMLSLYLDTNIFQQFYFIKCFKNSCLVMKNIAQVIFILLKQRQKHYSE